MAKIEINIPAPDFTLVDFTGRSVTLSDYLKKSNLLLVFNRGFVLPFCRAHMAQLRQDYAKFEQVNTTILIVGPENEQAFANYWENNDLPFIGLPDPKHSVLKSYGQQIKIFKWGRMPAQAIIDKKGVVRYIHYGHSMSDIPNNDELLEILKEINTSN